MEKTDFSLFGAPLLGGEASADRYGFQAGDGLRLKVSNAIFPIIRQNADGLVDLLGTGFFISTEGLFVSARHVLDAPFDRVSGKQTFPISMIHFLENATYFVRPILRYARHPVSDVAVAVVAPMTRNSDGQPLRNKMLTLNTDDVTCGARIATYAYPRYESRITDVGQIFNVMPTFYDGGIVEHFPAGRDRVMLPGPCYRTDMAIHHGASGGPVFSRDGRVFALNSTGVDGTNDSYISSIGAILDLKIDDVILGSPIPRSVSVRELAQAGFVNVAPQP